MKDKNVGRYINSNQEEQLNWEEFDAEKIKETQKILDSIDLLKKMEAVDSRNALNEVKKKIGLNQSRKTMVFLQRAAAILLLPLLSFSIWQAVQIADFNRYNAQNTVSTSPTLRSVFTLPDGTKVWMNGSSTITYPMAFKGKERLVELNGEAYFKVAHNKKQPFIVKTGKLMVEAVGTEFNCNAFADEPKLEVVLAEGKVNILFDEAKGRRVMTSLEPNQMIVYNKDSEKITRKEVDQFKYTAWMQGKIIFKNDRIQDVLTRLEHWYNVDFIVDPNVKLDYAFTGSFEGEELKQMLKYIELTTPVKFEIKESVKRDDNYYSKTEIVIKQKHKK